MATELTEYGKLLQSFRQREEGARLSNLSRKEQIENIYSDIIKRYEPGGGFGRGYESILERQKVRDVGASAQRDISRGLYGIRPYEQEWEATTGAAGRLKLEDIRMERLSGAQTGMAGFLERIEEPYPDYGALLAASQAQGSYSIPRSTGGAGGSGGGGGGSTSGSMSDWMNELSTRRLSGGVSGGGFQPSQSTGGTSGVGASLASRGGISGGQGLADPSKIVQGPGATGATSTAATPTGTGSRVSGMTGGRGKLSTWEAVKREYPNAQQLSTDTQGRVHWATPYK